MKVFVFALLFCTGIYFITKPTTKPRITEVSNKRGAQSCFPPNSVKTDSSHHKECCIILDRASIIIRQHTKQVSQ